MPIAAHDDLAALRAVKIGAAEAAMSGGALAAVAGFDPTGWTAVRFRLWQAANPSGAGLDAYQVGYLSLG